jgi:hypothetical protein
MLPRLLQQFPLTAFRFASKQSTSRQHIPFDLHISCWSWILALKHDIWINIELDVADDCHDWSERFWQICELVFDGWMFVSDSMMVVHG